ncbi:MAG: response regulator transcription factor, partial [Cyanobacteria bacterium P01_H01_bin.58]
MTASALNLFLVDEDPVFRLGLQIWLDQRPEFTVIGTAATGEAGLQQITDMQRAAQTTATDAGSPDVSSAVDVVIVDLALGQGNPEQLPGLQLCREIKQQFPRLMVMVLSAQDAPVLQQAAKQMGADGFGLRDAPVGELAMLIQQAVTPRATVAEPMQDVAFPTSPPPLTATLRQNSLQQIEVALTAIEQASTRSLPYWYRLVLAGQSRELKAARWLVQQLFPQANSPRQEDIAASNIASNPWPLSNRIQSTASLRRQSQAASIIPVEAVQTRVCEAIFRKLQFPLDNGSDVPLEIDILRLEKRRELLYTTLQIFERLLDDLQQAGIPLGQLEAQIPAFLQDLWNGVTVDFFGRYYTPTVSDLEQPMATVLSQDAAVVQAEILSHIPQVSALLAHLLFQTTLEVEGAD